MVSFDAALVALIGRVEDPYAAAERLRRLVEALDREPGIRALDDHGAERRSRLARVEVERLVAEEDVVRPARGGEPRGGLLPRLLAGGGLARVHVRRLVPAPGELDAEERGEADEDDGRLRPPRQAGQLQEAGGDEHLEERQGEDQVPALEEDARLRPGDHERERRDEQHRGGQAALRRGGCGRARLRRAPRARR